MSKIPDFRFYSRDWYEGTRLMTCEMRSAYMDLLCYQHQNEVVPNDAKLLMNYCTGASEEAIQAVLEAKFKPCLKGLINIRLQKEMLRGEIHSEKQSVNGSCGQFWKKAKRLLTIDEFYSLKEKLKNQSNDTIFEMFEGCKIDRKFLEAMLKATLEAMLEAKHKPLASMQIGKLKEERKERGVGKTIENNDSESELETEVDFETGLSDMKSKLVADSKFQKLVCRPAGNIPENKFYEALNKFFLFLENTSSPDSLDWYPADKKGAVKHFSHWAAKQNFTAEQFQKKKDDKADELEDLPLEEYFAQEGLTKGKNGWDSTRKLGMTDKEAMAYLCSTQYRDKVTALNWEKFYPEMIGLFDNMSENETLTLTKKFVDWAKRYEKFNEAHRKIPSHLGGGGLGYSSPKNIILKGNHLTNPIPGSDGIDDWND